MKVNKSYQNTISKSKSFEYIDIDILAQYITEQGKILPRRITGLTNKKQKEITKKIKRARILSLVPFVNK